MFPCFLVIRLHWISTSVLSQINVSNWNLCTQIHNANETDRMNSKKFSVYNNQDLRRGPEENILVNSKIQKCPKGSLLGIVFISRHNRQKSTKHRLAVYINYTLDNLVKSFFFLLFYISFQFLRLNNSIKQQKYQSSCKYEEE